MPRQDIHLSRTPVQGGPLPAVVALGGIALLGGLLVVAVAEPLSRSEIGGPGWSLRGNGALIVPFAGGPAILGGRWGALAAALVAGTVSLAASLVSGFLPVLAGLGRAAATSQVLQGVVLPLATLGVGLLVAGWLFGGLSRRALLAGTALGALVALVNVAAWGVSALLQPFLLPLLAVLPALASAPGHRLGWPSRWVATAVLLVPLCGLVGSALAAGLVSRLAGQR
jgi:hypothetical protein